MSPIAVPFIVKSHQPVLTFVLLGIIGAAIGAVCYWLGLHHHEERKRKKHGHSPHTGRHGNH